MVEQISRQQLIDYAKDNGYKIHQLNNTLRDFGYEPYNPLTDIENYKNLPSNLLKNAREFGEGARTIGGAIIKPISDSTSKIYKAPMKDKLSVAKEEFRKAVNNKDNRAVAIGTVAGGIAGKVLNKRLGGLPGMVLGASIGASEGNNLLDKVKSFANANLAPYNITLNDIKSGNVHAEDIAQGALDNPLYTLLDTAPVYGRPMRRAINSISNENAPLWVQSVLPSKELREFNRNLTQEMVGAKAKRSDLYSGYNALAGDIPINREEIVNHIRLGTSNLQGNELKIAESIRNNLIANEKEAIRLGLLDSNQARTNTVSQYVMSKLKDTNLIQKDIEDIIHNRPLDEKTLKYISENGLGDAIQGLIKEGEDLYSNNKIAFLTQKLAPSIAPEQYEGLARLINKDAEGYFDLSRVIGQTSSGKLAGVLDKSIKFQLDQVSEAAEAVNVLNKILSNDKISANIRKNIQPTIQAQRKQLIDFINNKLENKTPSGKQRNINDIVNSKSFNNKFNKYINTGAGKIGNVTNINEVKNFINNIPDKYFKAYDYQNEYINSFVKNLSRDLQAGEIPKVGEALSNSGVLRDIGGIYGEALKNAYTKIKPGGLRKFISSFKKAVLSQPHWIALNRIGNITNNAMTGTRLYDYARTFNKDIKKLLPERLKQQTSFSNYISHGVEGVPTSPLRTMAQPITNIWGDINAFANSKKSLGNLGDLVGSLFGNLSDITANPGFRIEAALELRDRFASFINKAEQYGKANNMTLEEVLKRVKTDGSLFNKINNQVNKALGDYAGRNYAIPASAYEILDLVFPFYRFLSQTGRTTVHQLINNPLSFHSMVTAPAKEGVEMKNKIQKLFGLDPEKYEGGVPYKQEDSNIRTIGFEPLPAAAVAEQLSNFATGRDRGILSPLFSTVHDVLYQEKDGRKPTYPGTVLAKLKGEDYKNYKPTPEEERAYVLNTMAQLLSNPYILGTRYGAELLEALKGGSLQTMYDTGIFADDKRSEIANILGVNEKDLRRFRNPTSYKRTDLDELLGRWVGIQTRSNYPEYKKSNSQKAAKQKAKRSKQAIQRATKQVNKQ